MARSECSLYLPGAGADSRIPDEFNGAVASISLVIGKARPLLSDVADISINEAPGEYDRAAPRRFLTVSANIYKKDLGTATAAVQKIIKEAGTPPKGIVVELKGMSSF